MLTKWRLKSCPWCSGDMYLNLDLYAVREWHCLQCSFRLIEKNKSLGTSPSVSQSGSLDNRRRLSTRQGVGV